MDALVQDLKGMSVLLPAQFRHLSDVRHISPLVVVFLLKECVAFCRPQYRRKISTYFHDEHRQGSLWMLSQLFMGIGRLQRRDSEYSSGPGLLYCVSLLQHKPSFQKLTVTHIEGIYLDWGL